MLPRDSSMLQHQDITWKGECKGVWERGLLEISRLKHGCLSHRHAEATALKFSERGYFGKVFLWGCFGAWLGRYLWCAQTHTTWWALEVTSVSGHRTQFCSNLDCPLSSHSVEEVKLMKIIFLYSKFCWFLSPVIRDEWGSCQMTVFS